MFPVQELQSISGWLKLEEFNRDSTRPTLKETRNTIRMSQSMLAMKGQQIRGVAVLQHSQSERLYQMTHDITSLDGESSSSKTTQRDHGKCRQ